MKYREEKKKAKQEGLRFCIACAKAKDPSEFYSNGYTYCRVCHNKRSVDWARNNPLKKVVFILRYRDKNPKAYAEIMRKADLKRKEDPVKYAKWKEQCRISARKYIENIRSNPVRYEAYLAKQREYYHQRKVKNVQNKGNKPEHE